MTNRLLEACFDTDRVPPPFFLDRVMAVLMAVEGLEHTRVLEGPGRILSEPVDPGHLI